MNEAAAADGPKLSPVEFVKVVLRNVSQVVLQNNVISGAIILFAIFYHSMDYGLAALAGSIVSTLTANYLKTDRGLVSAGLYGFNGVLTAIAIVFYCETAFDALDISWWLIAVYVFFGAVFSTVLTAAIGSMLSAASVPPLTAPFVLASWLFVAGTHFSPALTPGHMNPVANPKTAIGAKAADQQMGDEPNHGTDNGVDEGGGQVDESVLDEGSDDQDGADDDDDKYDFDTWRDGIGKGFGEIFFQDDAVSGYLILLGIAVNSRISALMACVGALISIGVAEALHIGEQDIHMGMFSYSAILTAIAIGGLFYLISIRGFIFTVFGIVFTTWLYAALAAVLLPLHLPPYTAPFVVVTWIMLYSKDVFEGLTPVPPAEATTPEENLKRFHEANS